MLDQFLRQHLNAGDFKQFFVARSLVQAHFACLVRHDDSIRITCGKLASRGWRSTRSHCIEQLFEFFSRDHSLAVGGLRFASLLRVTCSGNSDDGSRQRHLCRVRCACA